jgi:acyl carrier protein
LNPEQKLKDAFIQAIGLPPDTDFSTVQYGQTTGWDSVAHMQLVAEIENSFDIMFSTEQVIDMSSFQKGREIVASHGVSFAA